MRETVSSLITELIWQKQIQNSFKNTGEGLKICSQTKIKKKSLQVNVLFILSKGQKLYGNRIQKKTNDKRGNLKKAQVRNAFKRSIHGHQGSPIPVLVVVYS